MRAEELIVEIYKQRSEAAGRGETPGRVVMSAAHYHLIRDYHARVGQLSADGPDYLDPYRIFDLEICIEDVAAPIVEMHPPGTEQSTE